MILKNQKNKWINIEEWMDTRSEMHLWAGVWSKLFKILYSSIFLAPNHNPKKQWVFKSTSFSLLQKHIRNDNFHFSQRIYMFYKITGPSQVTLAVRLIGGGDQCTQRKPLANFIPIPSTPRHEWDLNSQL
jgi:hypothetical protein